MKKNIMASGVFLLFWNILVLPAAYAQECSPFQFGLWSSAQLVPQDKIVCGVRLDLPQGDNAEVWGLDAGLVNIAGASKGLQIGGVNWLDRRGGSDSWGMQTAGIMNYTNKIFYTGAQMAFGMNFNIDSKITGFQLASINIEGNINGIQGGFANVVNDVTGAQIGIANGAHDLTGAQIGLFANVADSVTGVQIGLANASQDVTGVQIGLLFNICRNLTGVQIGFLNVVYGFDGTAVPFLPFINVGWH